MLRGTNTAVRFQHEHRRFEIAHEQIPLLKIHAEWNCIEGARYCGVSVHDWVRMGTDNRVKILGVVSGIAREMPPKTTTAESTDEQAGLL